MPELPQFSTTAQAPFLCGPRAGFSLGWKAALIVLLYGATLLLVNLGSTRVLTYHEVLFSQPAKEMVATGRWIVPRFSGVPSTHKPPGAHWMIALVMLLTRSEAEGVVRIPAALAGVATALLVAYLGARWFGPRIGLVAGLMQATTYYVLQLARLAECDMLLVCAVTAAMTCFAVGHVDGPRGRVTARWLPWLFYACVTAAFFAKGLVGPVFIFSGCVLFLLANQDLRGLKFFLSPLGLVILLGSCGAWLLLAWREYPPIVDDQIWHHFGRFKGDLGGSKPPLFYVYSCLLITLPWAPFIFLGLIGGLRRGLLSEPFWRFTACWVVPGLIILALSKFQSKHYAAPLMPPLTIAGALALVQHIRQRQQAGRWNHLILALATMAGCGVAAAALHLLRPKGTEAILPLLAVFAVGMMVVTYFEYRRRTNEELVSVFVMTWLIATGVLSFVMPHHDSYQAQAALAARVNRTVPRDAPLFVVEIPESQATYYLRLSARRVDDGRELGRLLPLGDEPVYVLAPQHLADNLAQYGEPQVLDRSAALLKNMPENERMTLFMLNRAARTARATGRASTAPGP